jgi:hypothetical protein
MKKAIALALAAVLVGVAALLLLPPAAAGPSQSVSLRVFRTIDKNSGLPRVSFAGVISSGAAGQEVTVLQQACGASFATAVAGTQTREGGAWNAEPASPATVAYSATFRARWGDVQSDPVDMHPPMPIFLLPQPRSRIEVQVSTASARQDMKGRIVALQRLRDRKWTTVARKRVVLGRAGGFGFTYEATFPVRRGWTVRGFVPSATAAPCFTSNVTKKLKVR